MKVVKMTDNFTQTSFSLKATEEQYIALKTVFEINDREDFNDNAKNILYPYFEDYDAILRFQDNKAEYVDNPCCSINYELGQIQIYGDQIDPYLIARYIQHFIKPDEPIGFSFAQTCSRYRIDEFGGGFCFITKDYVICETTSDILETKLKQYSYREI